MRSLVSLRDRSLIHTDNEDSDQNGPIFKSQFNEIIIRNQFGGQLSWPAN